MVLKLLGLLSGSRTGDSVGNLCLLRAALTLSARGGGGSAQVLDGLVDLILVAAASLFCGLNLVFRILKLRIVGAALLA